MLDHCFNICEVILQDRAWRTAVYNTLLELYSTQQNTNSYSNICRCHFRLNDAASVAKILTDLAERDVEQAFQVAFDLAEYENEQFFVQILSHLDPQIEEVPAEQPTEQPADGAAEGEVPNDSKPESAAPTSLRSEALQNVITILKSFPAKQVTNFLFRQNNADFMYLKNMKDAIKERNSTLNSAVVLANGIMNSGTTVDSFLRDNMDWVKKRKGWSLFASVASMGMIHMGQEYKNSMQVLSHYLNAENATGNPHSYGGALYALGIIHAKDTDPAPRKYLIEGLSSAADNNEVRQHGECLGLGLVSMGSGDEDLYRRLWDIVMSDRACPGEAAAMAIGLVMAGCGPRQPQIIEDSLRYARDTKHEKIIRGLVMSLAFMFYNTEQAADSIIEQLMNDTNPWLRYGGCFTMGMAYVCTSSNTIIRRLLSIAVTDSNSDVRRAAVCNLGFVMGNDKKKLLRSVKNLSNSYHPHIRFGVCMALGTGLAGTADLEALEHLNNLAQDKEGFVKQAANIAVGMLLVQQNVKANGFCQKTRDRLAEVVTSRKQGIMSKFGAILGQSLIDAGGRNVTISMLAPGGQKKQRSIIGLATFWQYYFWFPYVPFISLAFKETMLMVVNKDLQQPDIKIQCNKPESDFAYPAKIIEAAKDKTKKKLEIVELSTTKKVNQRLKQKEKDKRAAAMDVDGGSGEGDDGDAKMDPVPEDKPADQPTDAKEGDVEMAPADGEKKEEEAPEPNFHILDNCCRIARGQRRHIQWTNSRYVPVNPGKLTGFVVVRDTGVGEAVGVVEEVTLSTGGIYGNEPQAPKPFKFVSLNWKPEAPKEEAKEDPKEEPT